MTGNGQGRTAGRLKLIALASLFFGPLILAWVWYFAFPGTAPTARSNRGHLIDPAQPLPESIGLRTPAGEAVNRSVFEDTWTLIYVDSGQCGEDCAQRLYEMRQVWASLHKNIGRVRRAYVTQGELPPGGVDALTEVAHKDIQSFIDPSGRLAEFFDGTVDQAGSNGFIYLLDPLGNWVLYYKPGEPLRDMLKDLKRLLKLSHIG
jgi:cytochrome oxidase Cu insertion factor (SCO1/SenC/PrrC family)